MLLNSWKSAESFFSCYSWGHFLGAHGIWMLYFLKWIFEAICMADCMHIKYTRLYLHVSAVFSLISSFCLAFISIFTIKKEENIYVSSFFCQVWIPFLIANRNHMIPCYDCVANRRFFQPRKVIIFNYHILQILK